ncbi:MAG: AgmX/PglI C-terminal domain-containing protein [Proteobacteria bacterium]|nr:AgmX/PglI C-terminal domain-containing protein [Pseudomonadota bacterium]
MSSPDEGAKEVIKVRLLRAGKVIRSYKVRSNVFTIGSGAGCTIRAAGDKSLAAKHATIYVEDGELTLVPEPDAKVLLNGEEVDFAIPAAEDIIKAGRLTFRVELAAKMESKVPAPAEVEKPAPLPSQEPAKAPKSDPAVARTVLGLGALDIPLPPMKTEPPAKDSPQKKTEPVRSKRQSEEAFNPFALGGDDEAQSRLSWRTDSMPPGISTERKLSDTEKPGTDEELSDDKSTVEDLAAELYSGSGEESDPYINKSLVPPAVVSGSEAVGPARLKDGAYSGSPDDEADYYFSDDDDEDEFAFEEPFDLAALLLAQKEFTEEATAKAPRERYCTAHVVRVVDGSVMETAGVLPGKPFRATSRELECRIKGKQLYLVVRDTVTGEIRQGGNRLDISDSQQKRGVRRLLLGDGDSALLVGEQGTYRIEIYRPPLAPVQEGFRISRRFGKIVAIALAVHLVVGVAVAYMQPKEGDGSEGNKEEMFADVKMDKPETKSLPKKRQPKKIRRKKDTLAMQEKAPRVTAKSVRKISKAKISKSESVNSLLKVLSKGSGTPGKSDSIKDLVSNIDAVPSKKGTGSSFGIAGAIASLPGDSVNIARKGGGGDVSTLSGDEVAGKGTGIGSLGTGKRSGRVRGKVTKMSSGAKVGGSLSRADVLRVINSNMHAIQACYERALMNKPSLSGRIAFDWTVTSAGKVKGVRVRSSTLGSPKVAGCISKQIRRWKFPRPKGGEAKITYPFLFRSVSS